MGNASALNGGTAGRRRILGLSLAVAVLGAVLMAGLTRRHSPVLPSIPEIAAQPPAVRNHLTDAYQRAAQAQSAEAIGQLAIACHADLLYEPALNCYAIAERMDGNDWRWKYGAAVILEATGRSAEAATKLRQLLILRPDLPHGWFRLGDTFYKQSDAQAARVAYEHAIDADRAWRASGQNDWPQRRIAFSIEQHAQLRLTRLALQQRQFDDCRQRLDALLASADHFGAAHRLANQLYHELGQVERAETHRARAAELPPYRAAADPFIDGLAQQSCQNSFLTEQAQFAADEGDLHWQKLLLARAAALSGHAPAGVPTQVEVSREQATPISESSRSVGKQIFLSTCAVCHGGEGQGLEGRAPALANSPWLAASPATLIRILLHGVRGSLDVPGSGEGIQMPALGALDDQQIADVLTYVRWRWGGASDPVSAQAVAAIRQTEQQRQEPWTAGELRMRE